MDQAEVKNIAQAPQAQPTKGGWYQRADGTYVVMFPNSEKNLFAAFAKIDAATAELRRKQGGR